MEQHLRFIGVLLIALSLVHMIFPRYFKWKEELQRLSLVNRQMVQVHTFFIALVLLLMGILVLVYPAALLQEELGRGVCFGFGIFWFARLLIQFTGYSSELWRGKHFETIVHILFAISWAYLSLIFFNIYFQWF